MKLHSENITKCSRTFVIEFTRFFKNKNIINLNCLNLERLVYN